MIIDRWMRYDQACFSPLSLSLFLTYSDFCLFAKRNADARCKVGQVCSRYLSHSIAIYFPPALSAAEV